MIEYYENGQKVSNWAEPSLHMYRDGEKTQVPLGITARAYLDNSGKPCYSPQGKGFCTLREIKTDFPWQQVWDDNGNNIEVHRFVIEGKDTPFVVAEKGWKGGNIGPITG